ncbi:MAG: hypothetical protein K2M73_00330 [Lachnospiraceae bacterium]|nr:hypothetical protein [Lachnospiraceae bacterium]
MRITNGIIMNNSLYNINNNKVVYDKLSTQMMTKKKIQRPSEDPIVAVRALRLRSTYSEICQYLEKNVPDARSWMKATNDALESINNVLEDITYYCNQGVNDYNTVDEREALKTTLIQLKKQIFADGDADLNSRTIFTGYKTDSTLTFQNDENDTQYNIKQTIKADDVDNMNRISGISTNTIYTADQRDVTNISFNVVKLAYDSLDSIGNITVTNPDGTTSSITPVTRSKEAYNMAGNSVYTAVTSDVVFIPETGELLLSDDVYKSLINGGELSIEYEKTGFNKGDLRPEHYFDCTNVTKGVDYVSANQEINYTINFNQTIKVNTQARDILTHDLARDLDEIIYSLQAAIDADTKIQKLKSQLTTAGDDVTKDQINSMIKAVELEKGYAEENMGLAFSKGITNYQNHQQDLNNEMADLGARIVRLNLNEERLGTHKLNITEQMVNNETIDVSVVAVELKDASEIYDASLMAASKLLQNSLLNFL